jgi:flagella basal body P-ring formation protein FlgA
MTRLVASLLALSLLVLPRIGQAETVLRPSVTVTGGVIRLGDLFSDAGDGAQDTVAPAPALGTYVTYNSSWLAATADEHHLDWTPASDYDQTTVTRASRVIGADAVAARLLSELAQSTPGDTPEIHLDNPGLHFTVPAEASDAMDVDGVTLDPRSGRFSAFVSAPSGATGAQRQRVTGTLVVETEVPVPNRPVAMGEVLGAGDIEQIKLPRDRLAADTIVDPAQLIGKSARHMLPAELAVHTGDVQDPLVVHKGDLVTIALHTAAMDLTAQGKALDDGALGTAIRVANTQSNRIIDATVAGPLLVVLGEPAQFAAR